jgi:hypothetical protein
MFVLGVEYLAPAFGSFRLVEALALVEYAAMGGRSHQTVTMTISYLTSVMDINGIRFSKRRQFQ